MTQHDPSFSADALMGTTTWVAKRLGRSLDWYYRNREELEADGFPKRDPLTKSWIKADVDRWIENRRQLPDDAVNIDGAPPEINYDQL